MGRFPAIFAIALGASLTLPSVKAQQADPQGAPAAQDQTTQDPLTRQRSDKERFKQQKELRQELHGTYKKWVDEDVHWIITDEELKAFKSLSNDEERDSFIEAFWQRRNPNPDSPENEFREEHYRRIAYANEHFAAGKPGWKTDRGHIYIAFGKPDSIESHPSGGMYDRPIEEGGGQTSTYPFETWHYRYLEGIGENIDIEFVDTCMCGEYHMTIDRGEKDALQHVPGAGQTYYEQMGMAKQADRFRGGLETLGNGPMSSQSAFRAASGIPNAPATTSNSPHACDGVMRSSTRTTIFFASNSSTAAGTYSACSAHTRNQTSGEAPKPRAR